MLNKIILMGRPNRGLELRRTQSRISVKSFSLAVDRDFKNQAGEKETDYRTRRGTDGKYFKEAVKNNKYRHMKCGGIIISTDCGVSQTGG